MIIVHGYIDPNKLPVSVKDHAHSIRLENCKQTHPKDYTKHTSTSLEDYNEVEDRIKSAANLDKPLDWVYFSAAAGAEPHKDLLDPNKFGTSTFLLPLYLDSNGHALLTHGNAVVELRPYILYEFDHTKVHSLDVEGLNGCTLIMAAEILK